ncbi:MAG TPA: hypothetical protein VFT71_02185 [Candidatus Nitrosocosmicus sp.]|nr:hypothetical protein [Candidatus Nitrosocosmicus sp.]
MTPTTKFDSLIISLLERALSLIEAVGPRPGWGHDKPEGSLHGHPLRVRSQLSSGIVFGQLGSDGSSAQLTLGQSLNPVSGSIGHRIVRDSVVSLVLLAPAAKILFSKFCPLTCGIIKPIPIMEIMVIIGINTKNLVIQNKRSNVINKHYVILVVRRKSIDDSHYKEQMVNIKKDEFFAYEAVVNLLLY